MWVTLTSTATDVGNERARLDLERKTEVSEVSNRPTATRPARVPQPVSYWYRRRWVPAPRERRGTPTTRDAGGARTGRLDAAARRGYRVWGYRVRSLHSLARPGPGRRRRRSPHSPGPGTRCSGTHSHTG